MKTCLAAVLIVIALLTLAMAGDWIVDNVSIENHIAQTEASATNTVMGALGVGTSVPQGKLHVAGTSTLAGTVNVASNRIINLAPPVGTNDAVNKAYVQGLLENVPPGGGVSMGVYTNH